MRALRRKAMGSPSCLESRFQEAWKNAEQRTRSRPVRLTGHFRFPCPGAQARHPCVQPFHFQAAGLREGPTEGIVLPDSPVPHNHFNPLAFPPYSIARCTWKVT